MSQFDRARSSAVEQGTFKWNQTKVALSQSSRSEQPFGSSISLCSVSFARALRSERRTESTINLYSRSIRALIEVVGDVDVSTLTREHVREFLIVRGSKVSPTTLAMDFRSLRVFCKWLYAEGETNIIATDKVRCPQVKDEPPAIYTPDELSRLLGALQRVRGHFQRVRDTAIVMVLLDCGMRRHEITSINVDDVDLDSRVILLRVTKNGEPRVVPLGARATQALDRYIRVRAKHRFHYLPELWLGQKGCLNDSAFSQLLKKLGDSAGVASVRPHRFRHTFAHLAQTNGMNTPDLMAIGGWKSVQVVMRYGRSAATERAIIAHAKHSPVDNL